MESDDLTGYDLFVAEYYDFLPLVRGRADLDFYLGYAGRLGDPILELGCGTGRILLPLAQAGHSVRGLDRSPKMLEKCRAKLEKLPRDIQERVRLIEADMTGLELRETFRLILVPFRPFQHLLTIEAQIACLQCAHRHLQAGGRIILDLFHTDPRRMHDPKYTAETELHEEATLPDGRRARLTERIAAFHPAEQTNDVEMIYSVTHPDGRKERLVDAFRIRYFFRYEVEHLLVRCGFRVVELFGNFDRSPFTDASPEMLFVAEKSPS